MPKSHSPLALLSSPLALTGRNTSSYTSGPPCVVPVPGNVLDRQAIRPCPKPAESEPLEWAQPSVCEQTLLVIPMQHNQRTAGLEPCFPSFCVQQQHLGTLVAHAPLFE